MSEQQYKRFPKAIDEVNTSYVSSTALYNVLCDIRDSLITIEEAVGGRDKEAMLAASRLVPIKCDPPLDYAAEMVKLQEEQKRTKFVKDDLRNLQEPEKMDGVVAEGIMLGVPDPYKAELKKFKRQDG